MSEAGQRRGRPSLYAPEVVADLCEHLAAGGLLIEWCRQDGRPGVSTVYRWMEAHPDFREAYARARETGLHVMAEEVISISDDSSADTITDDDGKAKPDHEWIARARLRVDSRKWLASKLLPKVYGDRQQLDVNDARPLAHVPPDVLVAALTALARQAEPESEEGQGG